jgi:tRNA nucleotidyltransferase/poly(A) polymerase
MKTLDKSLIETIENLKSFKWLSSLLSSNVNVYLVGGLVRDSFLGIKAKDIDLIVEGMPLDDLLKHLSIYGNVDVVGESFSVIKFKGGFNDTIDIALPRKDRKIGNGHKGFEITNNNVSVIEDLQRRDFTINSIAVNVSTLEIIDPFNGHQDILNKIIRATDKNSFVDDPLRILRGIQFAARFNFFIDNDTFDLMKKHSSLIEEISGERIFEELSKIINKKGNVKVAFNLLNTTGVGKALFGKDMEDFNVVDYLDYVSFFYVLCLVGNVRPDIFLKERLKVDSTLEKNVRIYEKILNLTPFITYDELFLFVFKQFEKAPDLINVRYFPESVRFIIMLMKSNKIPSKSSDIKISGDDIMQFTGIKSGPKIGVIKEKITIDALANKFKWNDREDCLRYLNEEIS